MKAVYIREFGGPENLEIREVPDPPKPAGTEVLARVRAASLNRADLLQRRGVYPAPHGYSPQIPGLEFAGEIADVGGDVDSFKIGDRVFGITAGVAQAEYLTIDARQLAKIPENLNFIEAAAIPEAFITAHDAIITQAKLKKGETLLIHAIGSGVGLAALQLAKAAGSFVIGTSRTQTKLDRCRAFGLDHAIVTADHPNFADEVKQATNDNGADVILDFVGGAYLAENLKAIALKGRWMLLGLMSGAKAEFDLGSALSKRITITGTLLRPRTPDEKADATAAFVHDVIPLLADGRIKPNVDRVFVMDDIRAAHEYLESNESFGKVVLEIR